MKTIWANFQHQQVYTYKRLYTYMVYMYVEVYNSTALKALDRRAWLRYNLTKQIVRTKFSSLFACQNAHVNKYAYMYEYTYVNKCIYIMYVLQWLRLVIMK